MFYNTFAFQVYKFHKAFNTKDTVSRIAAATTIKKNQNFKKDMVSAMI